MGATGKRIRLARIFRRGRILMVPFDDDLINGPFDGLADPLARVRQVTGQVDAILGYRGLLDACVGDGIVLPFVLNLTASTTRHGHTRKVRIGSVDAALRAGCDAVAVHVNLSSMFESDMLATLGLLGEECDRAGMPLVAIMYPRTECVDGDDNYLELKARDRDSYAKLVQHCVRIGAELGADLVKTQYTGDPDSFSSVVTAAMGVPVVIAGGPKIPVEQALSNAHDAVSAGAAGVCFGRNTYNRTETGRFVERLSMIVHDGRAPDEHVMVHP